jgi:hypothetical protein
MAERQIWWQKPQLSSLWTRRRAAAGAHRHWLLLMLLTGVTPGGGGTSRGTAAWVASMIVLMSVLEEREGENFEL